MENKENSNKLLILIIHCAGCFDDSTVDLQRADEPKN